MNEELIGREFEASPSIDEDKISRLVDLVAKLQRVVVAFSGGADSTLLLAVCLQVLGRDNVLAATADSPTLPRQELNEARALARELGAIHVVFASHELEDERFSANPTDRCFYCKAELFTQLQMLAEKHGINAIVYGATAADLGDHRPGMRAAVQAGAVAPLLDAGLNKDDVRALSQRLGLRTWNKPAMACLSSRFPYGHTIAVDDLQRVEQAEDLLRYELGFQEVRVRHHGSLARLEVTVDELTRLVQEPVRTRVLTQLKALGYAYVSVDLAGFRSGSMNEVLPNEKVDARKAQR
jgi:pyridinium-3,5-biscarboxylic acid mononucleotide sulfurtransferase